MLYSAADFAFALRAADASRPLQRVRVFILYLVFGVTGCDGLLDVENPNSVVDDDIRNDRTAEALANGALDGVQRAWGSGLTGYATVSDQVTAIGDWAGLPELDQGTPDNPAAEGPFANLAAGRWIADEAIEILDSLNTAGDLSDRTNLARAYFYGSISYVTIADWMDDFALSDRKEAAPPIGPDNMSILYDTAIVYLTAALDMATTDPLRRDLLAMRARARHARGVWDMIGRIPINVSGDNLVSDAAAVQDAADALAEDAADWRWQFLFNSESQGLGLKAFITGRGNLRFGDDYAVPIPGGSLAESIALLDPIDGIPDPRLERFILQEFQPAGVDPNLTVVSAREMRLIIAEDALARGDTAAFASEINTVRSLDNLSDWTPASPITARDMLIHERRTNLFLQGHRLNDMYRFGITSRYWIPTSSAVTTPGTSFSFPTSERLANCYLNPELECPR
jgi:hypothetical protein